MSIVVDNINHKAEYEKALLLDALSLITQKTKSALLIYSVLLIVVGAYNLKVKTIPIINFEIPDTYPHIVESILALGAIYMLIKFVIAFAQDYFRWRLSKTIAGVAHNDKTISAIEHRITQMEQKLKSLEPHLDGDDFLKDIKKFLSNEKQNSAQVLKIKYWHNYLTFLHYLRLWCLEFITPVCIAIIGISLSKGNISNFISNIYNAL